MRQDSNSYHLASQSRRLCKQDLNIHNYFQFQSTDSGGQFRDFRTPTTGLV